MFVNRNRTRGTRFVAVRIGLVFLGAGVWLAGLLAGNEGLTFAAILILLLALVLRVVDRSSATTADRGRIDPDDG